MLCKCCEVVEDGGALWSRQYSDVHMVDDVYCSTRVVIGDSDVTRLWVYTRRSRLFGQMLWGASTHLFESAIMKRRRRGVW